MDDCVSGFPNVRANQVSPISRAGKQDTVKDLLSARIKIELTRAEPVSEFSLQGVIATV
jgi:hypothetical protein